MSDSQPSGSPPLRPGDSPGIEDKQGLEAPSQAPVGRLAPSPTGRLHIGHARSFLLAWCSIRSRSGSLLLRIDDLDHTRVKHGMVDECLRDLEWLGLDWDGPLYFQSKQTERYQVAVDAMLEAGQAYACVCTRSEILAALSAPHADDGESQYPGTCRGRFASPAAAQAASGRVAGIRFQLPPGEFQWHDQFLGTQATDVAAQVGDFLIARRDQVFAYQLACAVDDAAQGVTEVLRGSDLASSAPRQALLQRALALPSPSWAHVPLVTDASGRRFAKRAGDLSLNSLREAGVDPRLLLAWIARSCGMTVSTRPQPNELRDQFDLQKLDGQTVSFTEADFQALQ